MFEIFINNNKVVFEKPLTVLQACEQANVAIPRFCYHEKLSVAGSCRMCLVEIEKSPKPVASCAMPISNGMVIYTDTPLVKKAREAVLEFLLINHPLDCPICDQGGECDLQDITLNFGSDRSRFFEIKRGVEDKECGPIVKTIMTRCIHCTRCVRFLTEICGLEVFGALGRGKVMEIGTYLNKYLKTELSGNLVDLCPVGALTSKPYAFLARNWELKKYESIDFSDAFCSNIVIYSRNTLNNNNFKKTKYTQGDQIIRILPKLNNSLNENWISDKTRYAFDGLSFNRNFEIKEFSNQKMQYTYFENWSKNLLKKIFMNLQNSKKLIAILGEINSIEEIFFFYHFLKNLGFDSFLFNFKLSYLNKDLPNFFQFNNSLNLLEKSDFILLVGVFPRYESSILNSKIRKVYFNKEVPVGYVGSYQNFNYPVIHFGNSLNIFYKLVEGSHSFCKKLRLFKNPVVIFGSDIVSRIDGNTLQTLIRFLGKKLFLNLKNTTNLNFLQQNLTETQLCELGLSLNSKNSLFLMDYSKKYFEQQFKKKSFIFQNYDFNNTFLNKKILKNNEIALNLNAFKQNLKLKVNFELPTTMFFEKNSLFLNTQGTVQKAFKVKSAFNLSRNSEDFFKILLKFKKQKNNFYITNKFLFIEAPFLKNININRKKFYINFLNLKESSNKIYFSNINKSIINFYMSDILSKNSKIMSECSLFFSNKSNFF